MNIGNKIIKLRKMNNMSQEELAAKLNVSRQSISKWESQNAIPDAYNILELSKLFNVTTDYLLYDEYQSDEDVPKIKEIRNDIKISYDKQLKNILLKAILWMIAAICFYIALNFNIIFSPLLQLNIWLCITLSIINFYKYFKLRNKISQRFSELDIYLMLICAIITIIITYALNRFTYNEIGFFTLCSIFIGYIISKIINYFKS